MLLPAPLCHQRPVRVTCESLSSTITGVPVDGGGGWVTVPDEGAVPTASTVTRPSVPALETTTAAVWGFKLKLPRSTQSPCCLDWSSITVTTPEVVTTWKGTLVAGGEKEGAGQRGETG